ncbi:hypothetical protein MPER_07711, partial [Moniliophthora perniciosa FA553]
AQFGGRMLYTFDSEAMHHIFVKLPGILHQVAPPTANNAESRVLYCSYEKCPIANKIDTLGWMGGAALEIIWQSGLGVSLDTLQNEETAHPLPTVLKQITYHLSDSLWKMSIEIFEEKKKDLGDGRRGYQAAARQWQGVVSI